MDKVLQHIFERHPKPSNWGRVLDAGTGESSLAWVCQLPGSHWTAITAEQTRAEGLSRRFPPGSNRLLVGNWRDPQLLQGEAFDVILADYLLGSCERYAPYFQEELLARLLGMCRGWLYIVGQEPWPTPARSFQQRLWDIGQLRDAVQLLMDRRPHRELPQAWVEQQIARHGYAVAWSERFSNGYDQDYVEREVGAIEENLAHFADRGLAQVLRRRCRELRRPGEAGEYGHDYVLAISAERPATAGLPPH